ncbi:hypothetical protein PAXRUDRAFT_831688 [Paxillus rubicundulus Ve08.2h10]|uniref:Uncharacterized protein n=1 Tax=Paxillus rubicundulus Ve08.2h10 TaxID=930991 RepID=A0A0D0DWL6_9AGAM|nr:hypothetical protein PAXRUDRAFT_831688 [Paxillus rubicundulus Ve08.2h10]
MVCLVCMELIKQVPNHCVPLSQQSATVGVHHTCGNPSHARSWPICPTNAPSPA